MLAQQDTLALVDSVGMDAVRAKSMALTAYAVELADELLIPLGVLVATLGTPHGVGGTSRSSTPG